MTPTGFLERFQIPGRVAVVTGGAGLLGSSHALALGQAGGRGVIADIDGAGAKGGVGGGEGGGPHRPPPRRVGGPPFSGCTGGGPTPPPTSRSPIRCPRLPR